MLTEHTLSSGINRRLQSPGAITIRLGPGAKLRQGTTGEAGRHHLPGP